MKERAASDGIAIIGIVVPLSRRVRASALLAKPVRRRRIDHAACRRRAARGGRRGRRAARSGLREGRILLDRLDQFDAPFFEYSPQEARIMDPQQRLLLEAAWEAFEDAGHVPGGGEPGRRIRRLRRRGEFLSHRPHPRLDGTARVHRKPRRISATTRISLSTRISYKLNLHGPSINVQTACSTSLVAVHLACQSILSGECDMALAGAARSACRSAIGYTSVKGGILSPDGHCRAFDADAAGTIFGSGVGIVLLKDLKRAIADRDHIYAVIRGSAINNDGADKISFTASSVPGQARAMVEAMGVAEIDRRTRSTYVECHGTGTTIGDPLEIDALTRAFRTATDRRGFCAIGSVKSNIGHLEQRPAWPRLIKTALSLHNRRSRQRCIIARPIRRSISTTVRSSSTRECREWHAQRARPSCRRQFARARRNQCLPRAGGSAGAGLRPPRSPRCICLSSRRRATRRFVLHRTARRLLERERNAACDDHLPHHDQGRAIFHIGLSSPARAPN